MAEARDFVALLKALLMLLDAPARPLVCEAMEEVMLPMALLTEAASLPVAVAN